MKLTPFESAIARVVERILKKHKRDIDAAATTFYTRAVGQAVEYLNSKTSPAVKANKTRKQMAAMVKALQQLTGRIGELLDKNHGVSRQELEEWRALLDVALGDAGQSNPA